MSFPLEPLRRALEVARLAPSAHNTQPWKVALEGERVIVRVDPRRHLSHSDPLRRDLHLGMGAFVEALSLGLRGEGVSAAPVEPPEGAFAALHLPSTSATVGAPEQEGPSLLRRRKTSRLAYSPREPEAAAVAAVEAAALSSGLRLHLVPRGTPERSRIESWFFSAAREAWLDPGSVGELRAWLRFDPEGARPPEDGLSTHCLNLGIRAGLGTLLAVRPGPWRVASALFAAPLLAEALATEEAKDVKAAPFVGLLIGEGGATRSGAGLLRTWLAAAGHELALHPISALLDRRGWEVAKHLGVPTGHLLFAFRLGRSAPPPRSGRLAVSRFAKLPV